MEFAEQIIADLLTKDTTAMNCMSILGEVARWVWLQSNACGNCAGCRIKRRHQGKWITADEVEAALFTSKNMIEAALPIL